MICHKHLDKPSAYNHLDTPSASMTKSCRKQFYAHHFTTRTYRTYAWGNLIYRHICTISMSHDLRVSSLAAMIFKCALSRSQISRYLRFLIWILVRSCSNSFSIVNFEAYTPSIYALVNGFLFHSRSIISTCTLTRT